MELACPACAAINRVPDSRLADQPNCGKCHSLLLPGKPVDLRSASFATFVSHSGLPVVIDFWASWCGPCKMMAPVFAQTASELATRARFAKVDTETEQVLATRYGIRSIPTLAIFRNGQEIARQAGAMDGANLKRWLAAHGV